ncbi:MAG: sigma 54-interacting transcriptional regulator [Candidatus Cloacimonetes bacterium]|nr:sigma 54-interacting transcriptional regulator [Candidatus Cloacimonadota bacterium]
MKTKRRSKKTESQIMKELMQLCEEDKKSPIKNRIKNWEKALNSAKKLKDLKNQAHIAKKLTNLYFEINNSEKALEFTKQTLSYYKATNNLEKIISTEINIAIINLKMNKFSETIKHFKALLNTQKLDKNNLENLYLYMGLAYYFLDNYSEALKCYEKTLELSDKEKDSFKLVNLYNRIGMVYKILGVYPRALEYLILSSDIANRLNNKSEYATVMNNIGMVYGDWGMKEKALEYFSNALKIKKEIGHNSSIAQSLTNIGTIHNQNGEYDKALEFYNESLKISKEIKDDFTISSTLNNIGSLYYKKGKTEKAISYIKEALKYKRKVGNQEGIFIGLQNLSTYYLELGKIEEALEYALECSKVAEETANDSYKYQTYLTYTNIFKKQKKYKKALDYLEKYTELKDIVFKKEKIEKIAEMQTRYETKQKEKEAEILRIKNEELDQKNKLIEEKNEELQETIKKLHHSEIKYNFVTEEMEKDIGNTFIGNSKAIKEIKKLIALAARSDKINVLITGESGTGKEVAARNIHKLSNRKNNNFYAVNTSAIPEALFESQIFGHEKNAFTGANSTNIGWFEIADESSLFLDEIGTLSSEMQVKLLRVLEDRKIVRIGSHKEIEIDVRIISATNINLLEKVRENKFRVDLYHRLATYVIQIPPLRERKEDIPLLLRHFVKHFSKKMNKKIIRIEEKLENALLKYDFPGNVRELKNMVERAILISNSSTLRVNCFIIPTIQVECSENEPILSLDEVEKLQIIKALKLTGFHRQKAADLLKVNRKVIERRIKKYNITPKK